VIGQEKSQKSVKVQSEGPKKSAKEGITVISKGKKYKVQDFESFLIWKNLKRALKLNAG